MTAALCLAPAADAGAAGSLAAHASLIGAEFTVDLPAPLRRAAVCVVDAGAQASATLDGRIAVTSVNGAGPLPDPASGDHGTFVAQVAAGADTDQGQPGIGPMLEVVSVRADMPERPGRYRLATVAAAIDACLSYPDVVAVNLSLGGPSAEDGGELVEQAVARAVARDVSVVAAAGNSAQDGTAFPARAPGVLAVGGTDAAGVPCEFSARDARVNLWAQGCGVMVADLNPEWGSSSMNGTSLAAPQVAAALAVLRAYAPQLDAAQAEAALLYAARPVAQGGQMVDLRGAFKLLGLSTQPAAPKPQVSVIPRADGRGWTVSVLNRPPGVTVHVRLGSAVRARARSSRITVLGRRWKPMKVTFARSRGNFVELSAAQVIRRRPERFAF